jgi:peptidyl-prolyl cis-trans isomerase B (cyclophilin B)
MSVKSGLTLLFLALFYSLSGFSQTNSKAPGKGTISEKQSAAPKKANERTSSPEPSPVKKAEPFDSATPDEMNQQCVTLQTDAGDIGIEVEGKAAPETVRNFLNLSATGAFDETTFSRVVPKFVIQGGNLATGQKWTVDRARRGSKTVPDKPNYIKHVRGVVSLARPDEPNQGSTHFFILVGDAPALDGKFAAFGKVISGLEVVDAINSAPVEGEKPLTPVVIKHAVVGQCR